MNIFKSTIFYISLSVSLFVISCMNSTPTKVDFISEDIEENEFTLGFSGESITMVHINAGSYRMGSNRDETGADIDEYPRHPVVITHDFWIGKYEVTQAQWLAVMNYNPSFSSPSPDRPVDNVSWREIVESFLANINESEESGSTWRLPTEAEWEYACRAGTTTPFSCLDGAEKFYIYNRDTDDSTRITGSLLPSPWGLYDMHGNVWEWCRDSYRDSYEHAPGDGRSWGDSLGRGRVIRGGSYNLPLLDCRSANREWKSPTDSDKFTGFRLVISEINDNVSPLPATLAEPGIGTENIPVVTDLAWSCLDPNGDPLNYSIYLGLQNNPPLIASNISDTTFSVKMLQLGEIYYWKIEADDANGGFSTSNISHFRTHEPDAREFQLGNSGESISMIHIEPGVFRMGSGYEEPDFETDEQPPHEVTINNGFWIGKYEITQDQWEAVAGNNPSGFSGYYDLPVENVSWEAINDTFFTAVNSLDSSFIWRLPTEAEWEYVCRAGTSTRYFWGEDLDQNELGNYAWFLDKGMNRTHSVGGKKPNPWGLYDILGNVDEWCEDWYHLNYYGAPEDGSSWLTPAGVRRVCRGGSWQSMYLECRSARKSRELPVNHNSGIGFRIIRIDR
ncbi:MAG: SUMF1/EgtB/PvdO family nonheme iron enzyme [Candidatus Electryonea clarkiae]|nr:SUMF1/EgtB/PvdO family nonheme iron enzyme [Candidatus Electryonea clarkiae]MDP8286494.1 SUMF1/EgtB/PvdO family nonheme iron enzyme [Candidatus Electryonea clarkiae]